MLVLLAALACETPAPQQAASTPLIDPKRNVTQASMAPVASVIIDPLIAGITFGAVDLSEITVEFGDPDSGALSNAEHDEVALSNRWDSPQQVHIKEGHSTAASSKPKVSKAATRSSKVGSGPELSIEAKEIEAAKARPMTVSQVVRKQRGKVQYCHDTGKTRDSQVAGRITVAWTIAGGKATDIQILDNTTGDELMAACVARQVRSFKFPKDMGEDVNYPFVFQQG